MSRSATETNQRDFVAVPATCGKSDAYDPAGYPAMGSKEGSSNGL